ncbi:MAG TPA: hypothetical protein VNT79_04675 [Phycisphaerae bacterium]|nr:hypothetical protein [Phycisphaerae bacterium]
MSRVTTRIVSAVFLIAISVSEILAQSAIEWSTIDGGGGRSVGGPFELSGTIGQPDAQVPPVMSGGSYELSGGFWPGVSSVCVPGDMNVDGLRDGGDVQLFVDCLLGAAGTNCYCGDFDETGTLTPSDVAPFVAALLEF